MQSFTTRNRNGGIQDLTKKVKKNSSCKPNSAYQFKRFNSKVWERFTCEGYQVHPRYLQFREQDLPPFNLAVLLLRECIHSRSALPYCPRSMEHEEGYAIGIGWTQRRNIGEYQASPLIPY